MKERTLADVVSRYKTNDPIRWSASPTDPRRFAYHIGEGIYQGTLDGKVLIRYRMRGPYGKAKTVKVRPSQVIFPEDVAQASPNTEGTPAAQHEVTNF